MIRTVTATRYVTPLREGGSLPAIVEAEDDGLYVLKFRAAGQGLKALIAEIIGGELARAAGLRVPELVLMSLDPMLGRNEPDYEIRTLLTNSAGVNLGMDYLPGSITFDPKANASIDPLIASKIVWLDTLLTNVDRTARNTNMLMWHKQLWLIDHGAALFFHHTWSDYEAKAIKPFAQVVDHVLLPMATQLDEADRALRATLTDEVITGALRQIPDEWLELAESPFATTDEHRSAYQKYLTLRRDASDAFVTHAKEAHAKLV